MLPPLTPTHSPLLPSWHGGLTAERKPAEAASGVHFIGGLIVGVFVVGLCVGVYAKRHKLWAVCLKPDAPKDSPPGLHIEIPSAAPVVAVQGVAIPDTVHEQDVGELGIWEELVQKEIEQQEVRAGAFLPAPVPMPPPAPLTWRGATGGAWSPRRSDNAQEVRDERASAGGNATKGSPDRVSSRRSSRSSDDGERPVHSDLVSPAPLTAPLQSEDATDFDVSVSPSSCAGSLPPHPISQLRDVPELLTSPSSRGGPVPPLPIAQGLPECFTSPSSRGGPVPPLPIAQFQGLPECFTSPSSRGRPVPPLPIARVQGSSGLFASPSPSGGMLHPLPIADLPDALDFLPANADPHSSLWPELVLDTK